MLSSQNELNFSPANGRTAEPPVRLLKYQLLKCINPLEAYKHEFEYSIVRISI
jgi:hypothetical protein